MTSLYFVHVEHSVCHEPISVLIGMNSYKNIFFCVHVFCQRYNISVLIRCYVHISIIGLNSLYNRIVTYHLKRHRVSAAIWYKKCDQIFVSSVNKNSIQYNIRDATKSYNGIMWTWYLKVSLSMNCSSRIIINFQLVLFWYWGRL